MKHKDYLGDHMFENYDEFYYYEDDGEQTNKRPKRSTVSQRKKPQCENGCCICKLEDKNAISEVEFRTYISYFLQVKQLKIDIGLANQKKIM